MKNDLEEKYVHGSQLFPFEYFWSAQAKQASFPVYCHWHTNMEVLIVEKGSFLVTVDGVTFDGKAGDIFFFNAEQLHQIQTQVPGSAYYSFVFSMQILNSQENDYLQSVFLKPLADEYWFPQKLNMDLVMQDVGNQGNPVPYKQILSCLEKLRKLSIDQPYAYQLLVKSELYQIVAVLWQNNLFVPKSQQISQRHSQTARRLKKVLQYIQENYKEKIVLDDAAEIMHMTPKYFSSYFSETFSMNFVQYLNHYRIEQAGILLQTTDLSILEVGMECGFDNFSYFIRKFKEIQGCTPAKYRKIVHGEK